MGWEPFKVDLLSSTNNPFFIIIVVCFYVSNLSIVFFQITYTSDYFQELYDLAVELIRRGHAYVDHQVESV